MAISHKCITGQTVLYGRREFHGLKISRQVPKELKWDLWLGTAQQTDYIDNLVPFNWRGWWRFGTGALGDMACHIIGPAFKLLDLGYPTEVTCSASTVYSGIFKEADYPESIPVSSKLRYKFKLKDGRDLKLYWMDGGICPDRPDELDPDVNMNEALAMFRKKMILKEALCLSEQKEKFPVAGAEVIHGCCHFH